jgi:hypothetical protein
MRERYANQPVERQSHHQQDRCRTQADRLERLREHVRLPEKQRTRGNEEGETHAPTSAGSPLGAGDSAPHDAKV